MSHPVPQHTKVKVVVSFPLGTGKPYKANEPGDTTVLTVRQAAMAHFGVHEDPGSRYFLTFGPAHQEAADDRTLQSLADDDDKRRDTLELTLVKELIQG